MQITVVGSRETPFFIQRRMELLIDKFDSDEILWVSGGALGMDEMIEHGAMSYRVFLPWAGFNDLDISRFYIDTPGLRNYNKAREIASLLWGKADSYYDFESEEFYGSPDPAWGGLKESHKKLHTRNVYEVLNLDLKTPSDLMFCYAEPDPTTGGVYGGTNTAFQLASKMKIPIINLWYGNLFHHVNKLNSLKDLIIT